MSCPSCSCAEAGTTCATCGSYISIENGRVQPVNTGRNIRVSDRNGHPRDLTAYPSSIPASDENGTIRNRDGSEDRPINLANLREVLAASKGVAVMDADGRIALLPKHTTDGFLVTRGDVITWDEVLPRANVLIASEIIPTRGKLLTLSCAENGLALIGFLNLDEADYIGIDSNGDPIGRLFCDADSVDTLDAIFGCKDGVMSKLVGVANKRLLINGDGKFYLDEPIDEETWVGGPAIWTKTLATPQAMQFTEVIVPFGGGVPNTANWVQMSFQLNCTSSSTQGRVKIIVNDVPVLISVASGNFPDYADTSALYLPYGDGTFKIRGDFSIFSSDSTTGSGTLDATVLSYK